MKIWHRHNRVLFTVQKSEIFRKMNGLKKHNIKQEPKLRKRKYEYYSSYVPHRL